MKEYRYTILLHPEPEEGGYSVTVPALPGCLAQGETLEEAVAMAKEAIAVHIDGLIEDGQFLPTEDAPLGMISISVAIPTGTAALIISSARGIVVKVRDVIKLIEADGWYLVVQKGSHRQYKHPTKRGRVTIAGHPGDDLATGTLNSVLKQAQLKEQ